MVLPPCFGFRTEITVFRRFKKDKKWFFQCASSEKGDLCTGFSCSLTSWEPIKKKQ